MQAESFFDNSLVQPDRAFCKAIAFYLPQYHPIPENDKAWGHGFTEWSNVRKAQPLFNGHRQPVIPGELSYYDLRDPLIQEAQSRFALSYGIDGFAYWYYWMGNGKRLLEKPLDQMLHNKSISIPFCLAWANESWTGAWHGNPSTVIAHQAYELPVDICMHAESLARYMKDIRYIRASGARPLFMVYKPFNLPSYYIKTLRKELLLHGLQPFIVAISNHYFDWKSRGYDALNLNHLGAIRAGAAVNQLNRIYWGVRRRLVPWSAIRKIRYIDYIEYFRRRAYVFSEPGIFPTCIPNWDNTPRSSRAGLVLTGSSPNLYESHLRDGVSAVSASTSVDKFLFLKSWNEWAEGNYLEPDTDHGCQMLEATRRVLMYRSS